MVNLNKNKNPSVYSKSQIKTQQNLLATANENLKNLNRVRRKGSKKLNTS